MKFLLLSTFASFTLLFLSCNSKETLNSQVSLDTLPLTNNWILEKSNDLDTNSLLILSLKENGYFMIYDSITSPKFKDAGISKIQVVSKGQWSVENKNLILNYLNTDSESRTQFNIQSLNSRELILLGENKKTLKYSILKLN
jgi:hypothetical protein